MNRFFVVDPVAYESTRLAVDAAVGLPPSETCLCPASEANKTAGGQVLTSVRIMHAKMEPYASAIGSLLENGAGVELSQGEWLALFPPPTWPPR